MHFRRERPPFLYETFSSPLYRGVECALWPALYHKTSLCESMLEGQDNRANGKIAFMHKLLSPVHDFALNFDILQYQYDHPSSAHVVEQLVRGYVTGGNFRLFRAVRSSHT